MLEIVMAKIRTEIEIQMKEGRPAEIVIKLNNHKLNEVYCFSRIVKKSIDIETGEIYFKKDIWKGV